MKVTFFRHNSSFSGLRAMLMQRLLSRNFRSFRSWSKLASSSVFPTPYITIWSVMSSTPSRPSRIWLTLFWKISEESDNPKGSLRQRYRPNSVAKVVRRLDSSSRLQCQNHERRSTVEEANEFEQVNMASFLPISDQRLQEIRRKTGKDKTLQIFKTVILQGWPVERKDAPVQVTPYFSVRDELSVQDGLILRSERVVVPQALRQDIRQRIHSSHMGYESCLSRARECVFWSKMNAEIREMIAMCKTCRKFEASQPKEPPHACGDALEATGENRSWSLLLWQQRFPHYSRLLQQLLGNWQVKQDPGQYSGPQVEESLRTIRMSWPSYWTMDPSLHPTLSRNSLARGNLST